MRCQVTNLDWKGPTSFFMGVEGVRQGNDESDAVQVGAVLCCKTGPLISRAMMEEFEFPSLRQRIGMVGFSAGGHLALWLGGLARVSPRSPIYFPDLLPLKAVISLAGVCDLRMAAELDLSSDVVQEFIGSRDDHPERYAAASPAELLPLGIPQFLLHGTLDENVPYEMSRRYAETARALGDAVELISFPGIGHFEFIDPTSVVWPRLLETALRNI